METETWTFGNCENLIQSIVEYINEGNDVQTIQLSQIRATVAAIKTSVPREHWPNCDQIQTLQVLAGHYRDTIHRLQRQQKQLDELHARTPRTHNRNELLTTLLKSKHITHAAFKGDALEIMFLPVLIGDVCSTPIGFVLTPSGDIDTPDHHEQQHPHTYTNYTCLGEAGYTYDQAIKNSDILTAVEILQQYRLGHNPNSEPDGAWRHNAVNWWHRHEQRGCPESFGWDGHTVYDPDRDLIGYVEWLYEKPLREIIRHDWSNAANNYEEEEDDQTWICACGERWREDEDYADCDFCHEKHCDGCLEEHLQTAHNGGFCQFNSSLSCYKQATGHCEECELILCEDDCLTQHNEEGHPEPEKEEDAPILPNIEQPGQLRLEGVNQ